MCGMAHNVSRIYLCSGARAEGMGGWPDNRMREQQLSDAQGMVMTWRAGGDEKPHVDGASAARDDWRRWCWLRHWEFWLALALGAFLRLWQIGTTQFLDDQAGLMLLARESILHHALPLTGIPSSIGTLNPPLSVYLLLPFALFTANPLPSVVTLALWNVAGVVFCYIFALRYFGRRVAAVGTLLFATGDAALNYSRFLWQQNYLPPLLAIWALTLYMGAVRGERRWLAGNIILLGIAVQLHPTALLLAPVTLAGILLAPRFPRPRAYIIAAVGLLILFVPTLMFEAVSRGFDLRKLAHYALQRGRFDPAIAQVFWWAQNGPNSTDLGPQSPYALWSWWYPIVTWGVVFLIVGGWIVLTIRVFRPAVALWRPHTAGQPRLASRAKAWGIAVWRGLRADQRWRALFLLWLWITLPPVTMIHHSAGLFVHYLLVIYPAVFLAGGFGVDWLLQRLDTLAGAGDILRRRALPGLALGVVALLIAGQSLRFFLYPTSIAIGSFRANASYGYPLDEMLALDDQLTALQRQQGATATYVITPEMPRYRLPAEYLLADDRADRVAFPAPCLVLPAPGEGAALAVSLAPGSPAETLLAALPTTHVIAHIPLAGGSPLAVYRLAGGAPVLADETSVPGVEYLNGAGDGLRLESLSFATPGMLRLRWTVIGAPPAGPGSPLYRVQLHVAHEAGATPPLVDCAMTHLRTGETVYTWLGLPGQAAQAAQAAVAGLDFSTGAALEVSAGTQAPDVLTLGPIRFLTARGGGVPLQRLTAAIPALASTR